MSPDGNDYDEDEVTNDEDMEQYRGLIPGKKLHSLQTDKVIQDEDLGFIVNNMDTLRKLGVPNVPLGIATMDALRCHHATIVELSLQYGSTNTSQVLSTVTGLAQLVVLALDLVNVADFVQSGPWAFLGLRQLSITFPLDPLRNATTTVAESRAIWQRMSCLTQLEHLNTYGKGIWLKFLRFMPAFTLECGLGQLSTMTELRRVDVDLQVLAAKEADWIIGAWPKLKVIRC